MSDIRRWLVLLCLMAAPGVSLAQAGQPAQPAERAKWTDAHLDDRFDALDDRIETSVDTIEEISRLSIEASRSVTTYISVFALLLGAIGTVLTGFGVREVAQIRRQRRDIRKLNEDLKAEAQTAIDTIDRELKGLPTFLRALPLLWRAQADPKLSVFLGEEALRLLEDAEREGFERPQLFNWKGYALKRCGRLGEAIDAVARARDIAPSTSFEYRRAVYNSACYYCLLEEHDAALRELAEAIRLDPRFGIEARADDDFAALRGDHRFVSLLEGADGVSPEAADAGGNPRAR